jgi:hypothetical protein
MEGRLMEGPSLAGPPLRGPPLLALNSPCGLPMTHGPDLFWHAAVSIEYTARLTGVIRIGAHVFC